MMPTLRSGEVVILEGAAPTRRGEIAAFGVGNDVTLVAHRVLSLRGDSVVCRGDNRRHADSPVPADAVIGIVGTTRDGRSLPVIDPLWFLIGCTARQGLVRPWRWLSELRLLAGQISEPRGNTGGGGKTGAGHGDDATRAAARRFGDGTLPSRDGALPPGVTTGSGGFIVSADLYSRLPLERRSGLLATLPAGSATIYAYAREMGGRRLLLTSFLRRRLRALGVDCGLPGDLTLPPSGEESGDHFGPRPYAHVFTPDELADELRAVGVVNVEIDRESGGGRVLLRARADVHGPDPDPRSSR